MGHLEKKIRITFQSFNKYIRNLEFDEKPDYNYWINYFKDYINKSGFNALIGDSLYIIAWALSFYFVANHIKSFDTKIFIICLFLFLASAYSVQKSN